MTRIIKTILCLGLLAFARISKPVQAQTVRGVWVNTNRTDPNNLARSSKKGSSLRSARSLSSSSKSPHYSSKASKKKSALKLSKKTRAPIQSDSFQPAPRLETPIPVASPSKFLLVPIDPKSSDIPSDAPSLVPTNGWSQTPTVWSANDENRLTGSRTFDIHRPSDTSPTHERMLAPHASPPTKTPTTHAPTTNAPSSAPPTTANSWTVIKEGDKVTSTGSDSSEIVHIPPVSFVLVVVAAGIAGTATYFENKWRTQRALPQDGVVEEGRFVNN